MEAGLLLPSQMQALDNSKALLNSWENPNYVPSSLEELRSQRARGSCTRREGQKEGAAHV